jgi:hypothetical protein
MERVPVRIGPVLAATVNATVPLPLPLPPPVIVIQGVDVVAVQVHPAGLVTVTEVAGPPAAVGDWFVGLIVATHPPA